MGKTGPLWRNIALCELCFFTSSHEFISSPDVSKLRRSCDHVGYGDRKTINVKAVCTCERHETTSSDNCDIVMIVVGISHQLLWNCCGQTVCHKVFNCKQSTLESV